MASRLRNDLMPSGATHERFGYGPNGPVRFAISLTPQEAAMLDAMAREANMRRAVIAASLIRHVLIDDAEAHSQLPMRRRNHG